MVEQDLAKVPTVRQVVPEVHLAPEGDVPTELVPPRETGLDRLLKRSVEGHQRPELPLRGVQRRLLPLKLLGDLLDRRALPLLALLQRSLDSLEVAPYDFGLARVREPLAILRRLRSPILHGLVSRKGSETNSFIYLELLLHVPSCHLYRCQLLTFSLGLALVMFNRLDLRHPIRNGGRELVLSTHSEIVLMQFDVAEVTHSDFSLLLAKIGDLFAERVLLGHDRTQLRVGLLLLSGIVFELCQDRRLLGLLLLDEG